MKVLGIILIVLGACGIGMGMLMIGDIGIACIVGGLAALLSGIALTVAAVRIQKLEEKVDSLSRAVVRMRRGTGTPQKQTSMR